MPLYSFKCPCGNEFSKLCKPKEKVTICTQCNEEVTRSLCRTTEPAMKILLDKYRKKGVLRNINQIMKKRSWEHQKSYELGEMISKHGEAIVKRTTSFFTENGKVKKKFGQSY